MFYIKTQETYYSNSKLVISGNIVELYEYGKMIPHGYTSNKQIKKRARDDTEGTSNSRSEETERISLSRARKGIRRLINANAVELNKFVTLTFAENLTDVDKANYEFKKFIERLKFYLKKAEPEHKLKYISVIEFQKRGAVHYHVLFNLPYIDAKMLNEIWGNGFIKINKIDHIDNVGAYVSKYMSKDERDQRLWNKKMYFTSRNLDKPIEITKQKEVNAIIDNLLADRKPTYTTSFENEFIGLVNYKQFNLKI